MRRSKTVHQQQRAGAGVAAAALVAAAMIPMTAARHTAVGGDWSADVALTAAIELANAFDLEGLLQAEVAAGQGVFNDVIGFPGALIGDVVTPIEHAISDVAALNFGDAFSSVAGIPVGLANTVIGLPEGLIEGLYNMALQLPGQYLFNFGGDPAPASDPTGDHVGDPAGSTAAAHTDLGSTFTALTGGSAPELAASTGPHFLDFNGLLGAEAATAGNLFFGPPLSVFGFTADVAAMPFLAATSDALHLDFTGVFTELAQGFEGEGGLLDQTALQVGSDTAQALVLDPAYYLLDVNPLALFAL